MNKGAYLASVCAVVLSGVAAPAFAQSDGASTAQTAGSSTLGEIVVTARKRSESVQDIPVTVAAVEGDLIAKQGVTDLFQAVTLVPGLVFSRAPDDGLALTVRGLGTAARPQAFEQSVAVFTDGIFIGKGRLYSTSLFDVDRVEFIKGTQSTLLGKNASIGAISIVSRQPGDRPSFEGRGAYEFENGGYTLDAAGDLPFSDSAALRLAVHRNDMNGWVRNDFTGDHGPRHRDLGVRATLRADLTPDFRLTASYQYGDNEQIGASYQLVGPIPPQYGEGRLDDHTAQFTARTSDGNTYHQTKSHMASVKGDWDVGPVSLVSQISYIKYDLSFFDDFDFSVDDSINFLRAEDYEQLTGEFRVVSPAGQTFEYMAGLFYMDSAWDSLESQLWRVPGFPPAGGPPPGQLFNGPFANHFVQDAKAYSVFGSSTWRITNALRLAAGLRYTREEKEVLFSRTAAAPFTIWNTIANPPFGPTSLSHKSDFVDGNISLQYDLTPDVMVYVSYGHGSKSGGFVETNTIAVPPTALVNGQVPAALVAAGSAIKDEFTDTYEVGLKSTLLDRRLRLNLTGFWTEIEDFQDTVFTGGTLGFITFNGPSRSKGVEVEAAWQVTSRFHLDGGLTYADSTAVIQPINPATNAPQVDGSGNPVFRRYRRSQAPELVFNTNATYEAPLNDAMELRLSAGVRHRSSMYNQRQEQFLSEALTTLDLSIGLQSVDDRWSIDLLVKNVTDEVSEDFASPSVDPRFGAFYGAYLAGPNPLRSATLSLRVKY